MILFQGILNDKFNPVIMTIWILNIIFVVIFSITYLFQHIHAIVAMFTKKKEWKEAFVEHTFGFLISGRNEELVIGNLIDSIYLQKYDQNKIKVFVCADNCTDKTAEVARKHGAIVYERNNKEQIGKSYALDFLIKNVLEDESNKDVECFLIFDADNLVSENYLSEMNKTFDAGYEVSTSFRESKNFGTNWISACSSLTFYRECCLVHHSREKMHSGTYVSGTGYFVSRRILGILGGWNFNTMTEDIEFSIWCATNGIDVTFNENAIFYDEQPETLKVANTQRLRWCKGTHQCCHKNIWKLIKGCFVGKNKQTCFELLVHVVPFPIISFAWLIIYSTILSLLFGYNIINTNYYLTELLKNVCGILFFLIVVSQFQAGISLYKNRKNVHCSKFKKVLYTLLFPVYVTMYIPLSFKALFVKVKWKQIPHISNKTITEIKR